MPETVTIQTEDPSSPEVLALLAASEAHSAALYPPGSRQLSSLESLRRPEVSFFVARRGEPARPRRRASAFGTY